MCYLNAQILLLLFCSKEARLRFRLLSMINSFFPQFHTNDLFCYSYISFRSMERACNQKLSRFPVFYHFILNEPILHKITIIGMRLYHVQDLLFFTFKTKSNLLLFFHNTKTTFSDKFSLK